ncbi:MAG: response regulator [Deltaproteobacteria bacterium]|nr:response regulator [Deltaproteobacteria bacterium]
MAEFVRGANVLIVDDDADAAAALTLLLQFRGYEVAEAENGASALDYLSRNPSPSLIILDLFMPQMNGWEFRRHLAGNPKLARIPILVTTAFGRDADIEADAILVKPVDIERLLALVDQIIGRSGEDAPL